MVRGSLVVALAMGLCLLACVKADEGKGQDGSATAGKGGAGNAGGSGGGGSGGGADAAIMSCRDIRNCVFNCKEDKGCAASCVSAAPQAARALYQQARMCSENACPTQDPECRCSEECHGGGMCTEVVDECDEAISDLFCDGPCH